MMVAALKGVYPTFPVSNESSVFEVYSLGTLII